MLILVNACQTDGVSSNLTTTSSNRGEDQSSNSNFDLTEVDLVLLHESGSGLIGGDLSDDGNILVFADSTFSGIRNFRKDLSNSSMTKDDEGISELQNGSGSFWLNTGFVTMSGYDGSNFRIDGDGDYSYFSAYSYNQGQISSILFRKSYSSDESEEIFWERGGSFSKGSISKNGEFLIFSSTSVEHLPYNPLNNNQTNISGITNIFRLNTLNNEISPITERALDANDDGFELKFASRSGSISNDGNHVLFTVTDQDQNMYSQPDLGGGSIRNALIYKDIGFNNKTIVINDVARFPSRYTSPLDQRISSNGLHAVFSVASSGYTGSIEIWHFDSTTGTNGNVKLVSTNESGTKVHASLNETKMISICDISPDGKYVALISNNMNFIGKDTVSGPHLFLKDVQSGKVQLITSKTDGSEIPGRALNCYFTEKGSSLLFTHEHHLFTRRLLKRKITPSE
jgi:hypothetical protein